MIIKVFSSKPFVLAFRSSYRNFQTFFLTRIHWKKTYACLLLEVLVVCTMHCRDVPKHGNYVTTFISSLIHAAFFVNSINVVLQLKQLQSHLIVFKKCALLCSGKWRGDGGLTFFIFLYKPLATSTFSWKYMC